MKLPSSVKERRKEAGAWLRGLRERAGLTQMDLAIRLGFKYYAFVSQVETGFTRLPPQKVGAWGSAVGADPVRLAASFYEPELHRVLYEDKPG
jgi:transcriptional regulator with XRE-family HTH domain